jgi:replicative DNA helicase
MFQTRREKAEECLREVVDMPVYFEDHAVTVEQIRVLAGKYKRKHKIQIMFLDGMKDIIPSKGENATKQEEHISRVLVQTAKELDIAIVPVCHLTDIPENIMIHRRNLRGAKSQFHNARQVLIFQNAGLESSAHEITENTVALHMEKNNYGRESSVFLEKSFDRCDFDETPRLGY